MNKNILEMIYGKALGEFREEIAYKTINLFEKVDKLFSGEMNIVCFTTLLQHFLEYTIDHGFDEEKFDHILSCLKECRKKLIEIRNKSTHE